MEGNPSAAVSDIVTNLRSALCCWTRSSEPIGCAFTLCRRVLTILSNVIEPQKCLYSCKRRNSCSTLLLLGITPEACCPHIWHKTRSFTLTLSLNVLLNVEEFHNSSVCICRNGLLLLISMTVCTLWWHVNSETCHLTVVFTTYYCLKNVRSEWSWWHNNDVHL